MAYYNIESTLHRNNLGLTDNNLDNIVTLCDYMNETCKISTAMNIPIYFVTDDKGEAI
tara:strand:+ start:431 stop:604 length:174 start_codon:yes stop_codon:yes gene_type:complete